MTDLDRRIATEVMGWEKMDAIPHHTHAGMDRNCGGYWNKGHYLAPGCWSPSTDLAASFQVVERMREQGWFIEISQYFGSWRASFGRKPNQDEIGNGDESLPKAISLAALAACQGMR